MSNFRDAQANAHPNKINTLLLAIIIMQVLIVSMQIWMLYSGLNNALAHNKDIALPASIASIIMFIGCSSLLYFLPGRK